MTMNHQVRPANFASRPSQRNATQNVSHCSFVPFSVLTVALLIVTDFLCQAGVMVGHKIHRGRGSIADNEAQVASEQLNSYWRELQSGASFNLRTANQLVYANTTHDDNRRISFTENWMQWCLGQFYDPILQTQDTASIIRGNRANCSGRCQVLKSFAEAAGLECRFVGLNGHVVLEVKDGARWRVADPDYNVVYNQSLDELKQPDSQNVIRRALRGRYSRQAIKTYTEIFQSAEDNVRLPIGEALSPRLNWMEQTLKWLVWLTPLPFLLFGQILALK
jgi:hypothetical protein